MTKKIFFRVDGTTCGSCEILLERAFRKLPGVQAAKVSNRTGRVQLTVDDNVSLNTGDLSRAVNDSKYRFSPDDDGSGSSRVAWDRVIVALTVAFSVYFVFIRSGIIQTSASPDASSGLLAIFGIGLVAAFSSCAAVVGGMVAAIAASTAQNGARSFSQRVTPHLLFNTGRVIGFAVFGAAVGAIGSMLGLSPFVNGLFLLMIAVMMVGIGLNLLGAFPGGSLFGLSKLVARFAEGRGGKGKPLSTMLLGALTFFLPCGFTQSVQLLAAATGSPTQGAVIMAVFALGNVPALLGLGIAASAVRGRVLKVFSSVVGIFIIAVGYANIVGATILLDSGNSKVTPPVTEVEYVTDNGEQVIQMEITDRLEYAPDTLYVREGVPVRWEIFGDEFMGCASSLVLREFGVSEFLSPGFNVVCFTPSRAGTYRFTCSMGMTKGTMIVIPKEK
ncbi:MAG: sulfite exporter TauE/SafE family protein [Patescibacteria group bacterium]